MLEKLGRMLASIVFVSLCSCAGFAALLWFAQKGMIFHPGKEITATPASLGLEYEDVTLKASDGVLLNAWFVPAKDSRWTVLFCHGNAGNISHRLETIQMYNKAGFDFFLFDYRGYGLSGGEISEKGLYSDAVAAWRYLTESRKIPPDRIIVVGRSLGGAVASSLAAVEKPAGLVLESSFVSIPEMGRGMFPFLPVRMLARFGFDNAAFLASVSCPVLLAHSRDDEIVPFRHAPKLFDAIRGPKKLLELRGGHNECYFDCEKEYMGAILAFADSLVKL